MLAASSASGSWQYLLARTRHASASCIWRCCMRSAVRPGRAGAMHWSRYCTFCIQNARNYVEVVTLCAIDTYRTALSKDDSCETQKVNNKRKALRLWTILTKHSRYCEEMRWSGSDIRAVWSNYGLIRAPQSQSQRHSNTEDHAISDTRKPLPSCRLLKCFIPEQKML